MFSKYFPSVSTIEDAEKATRGGIAACMAYAVMISIGIAFMFWTGHALGAPPRSGAFLPAVGVDVVEIIAALIAAWRFKKQKGLVIGTITLILFLFEVVAKFLTGTTNVGWVFFYIFLIGGFINGIRAANAYRTLSEEAP